MYRFNTWTQFGKLDQTKLQLHRFYGNLVYSPSADTCRELDRALCESLKADFGVYVNPAVTDQYRFYHGIEVYYDSWKKKHLVYEQMALQIYHEEYFHLLEEGWDECPFKLRRCNYVDDYSELVSKFRKYASERTLYDIGNIVGTCIGHNLELMDELF